MVSGVHWWISKQFFNLKLSIDRSADHLLKFRIGGCLIDSLLAVDQNTSEFLVESLYTHRTASKMPFSESAC